MRPFIRATSVAGTLDILAAIGLTLWYGKRGVDDMLRFVASGPVPGATGWGLGGAILGLVVHFALMAVMVLAYLWAAERWPQMTAKPLVWGVIYGLITYVIMNLIVVPLRFGTPFPPSDVAIATQLFCHIVLVGIPLALITARDVRGPRA